MKYCVSDPKDRLIPTSYPVEWKRHGSAAMMEWIYFCACFAQYDGGSSK